MLYYRRGQGKPTTIRAAAVKRRKVNAMNYKTAYKKLNQNGVIDEIINREVGNGAILDMVKYHIIEGINYYIDFTKTLTFKGMTYGHEIRWLVTDDEKLHRRIVNAVCKALAQIEIEECATYAKQLQYMIDVQREV